MTLWVLSPVLNDTESFLRVRQEVATTAGRFGPIVHVVVDDSAGADPELAQLRDLPDVRVVTPPFNLGHQRAIVFGLREHRDVFGDDDVVVTMDADGEDRPADVPRLVEALDADGVTLAVATRTERHESFGFRLMYLVFKLFFRIVTGTSMRSGNFAAHRADALRTTINHPSFDLCYSSTLLTLRRVRADVPCARGRRYAGRSRMNRSALVAHGIRMLLPFTERIAARLLGASVVCGLAFAVVVGLLASGVWMIGSPSILAAVVAGAATLAIVTTVGFLVLFAGFSQSAGITVMGIGARQRR